MSEWIKIDGPESIPVRVPLWMYRRDSKRVFFIEPCFITGHRDAFQPDMLQMLSEQCSHYMRIHMPKPPEEEY